MSQIMLDKYFQALLQTLEMVGVSMLIAVAAGMIIAILLTITSPGGLYEKPVAYKTLSLVINLLRSVPFIILLVAILPFTRFIVGTTLGTWAAIVPISINLIPFFARISEVSLRNIDNGLIEAAKAMGCRRRRIIYSVLLPEALPSLVGGITVTTIALVETSAMAGAVGGGGLGDMAVRYGYERYETQVMIVVIVILIALVSLIQIIGDLFVRKILSAR
ncbi:ABC transporter permease [Candidatus Pantoea deserta]|uniref:D-methionine transport system permease protein MetI n=1 Tax=Candidatus Pantoea deserta TaxID=1869313 RepID=A0A3N4NNB9_9GAMM|nr:methionine ABC transporter permease [Pantoea deserta]RPD93069.1 ABC transporter permease [Pantoea deserta]